MKKIYFTMLLVLSSTMAYAQTSVWSGGKEIWARGAGTENDPYLIESAENLAFLAYAVNKGYDTKGMCFKLTTDIDLNGSENQQWIPIGLGWFYNEDGCIRKKPNGYSNIGNFNFMGQFDGDGHIISNIYIDTDDVGGLFGNVNGTMDEPAEIRNVFLTNGYIKGEGNVGGIVGHANYCNIVRCWNGAEIEGGTVGGIVGRGGIIYKCFNKGRLTGSSYVGGIVGLQGKEIIECYNKGEIFCPLALAVGGIIGANDATRTCTVANCYNTSAISGCVYFSLGARGGIGGIIGIMSRNTNVTNCYNVGKLSNEVEMIGGIFATNMGGTVFNCYYLNTSGGGDEGLTAEEMRNPSFVDTLNYETDVWGVDTNNINDGYPILINNYYLIQYNLEVRSNDITLGQVHVIQQPDFPNNIATVLAESYDGNMFFNWTVNGEVVSTANPYTFVVDGDIELVGNFKSTGVDEEIEQRVMVSPNPTTDKARIICENMKCITLCTLEGRTAKVFDNLNTDETEIDFTGLPKGLYLLRIELQNGLIINMKTIIQ